MTRELRCVGAPDPTAVVRLASATGLDTLEDVIRWGLAQAPAMMILEIVVQDEYNHDVIVGAAGAATLCFDTT